MSNVAYKVEVMRAYDEGKDIEMCKIIYPFYWADCGEPRWNWETYSYRIKRSKPSINWDHVHKDYNYMARDMDGGLWLFETIPTYNGWIDGYWVEGGRCDPANTLASATPGDCDWKDSLVARPQ